VVRDFTMTIGGQGVPAMASFDVDNPATGEVIASVPECSAGQLDLAMQSAQDALGRWRADAASRHAALAALAGAVEASTEELARLITSEQGKPLAESRAEMQDAVADLRFFASLEVPAEAVGDGAHAAVRVLRRSVGPVAAITPWNFPLGTAVAKIAPGLAAGCTMVVKPSPFTPLACLSARRGVPRASLPPGVLNIISGSDQVGEWMSRHPVPRMVSFTGSIATGKRIAGAIAPDLKRATLELGGNDPAIVLDDVDVGQIAVRLFGNAFANCGQVCVAVKRVYVPERLHDELVAALADRASGQGGRRQQGRHRDRAAVQPAAARARQRAGGGRGPQRRQGRGRRRGDRRPRVILRADCADRGS
jgi:acyl-CoA reductase-like NAD-dependent aldehyde dehydrogenase